MLSFLQSLSSSSSLLFFSFVFLVLISLLFNTKTSNSHLPNSYPLIGSYFALTTNLHRRVQWTSDILRRSPAATFTLNLPLNRQLTITGNPDNVQHILKTHFHLYEKGDFLRRNLSDFLGDGIFNADGEIWKFQRKLSSYEFNTRSLRFFVESVVDTELHHRLIPILSHKASSLELLDLQDILQRFAFDNICKIAFGYDPGYLSPSLPKEPFAEAFEASTNLTSKRVNSLLPFAWKTQKFFNIGSEKRLKNAVSLVRDFARNIVREKKEEITKKEKSSLESADLLSRFLSSGYRDEEFVIDIVVSFILAGRDTTSAALTWFFWLLYKNPRVEAEIVKEITAKKNKKKLLANDLAEVNVPVFEGVKEMVYTHAALCESMRLYPPVPMDSKVAMEDDVLPDGTRVRKGNRVQYHPYAMGRLEALWGPDWEEFKPERWLKRKGEEGWGFVGRDPYSYPVFQAGPRICLGKEMAFLQMKMVVAGVLERFRVVPAVEGGGEPVYVADLTAKVKGGLPVRIVEREY